jgi:chromosome segregation ATPase
MSIKVSVTCHNCKDDIEIGADASGVDDVVCLFCWGSQNETGAEELSLDKEYQKELTKYATRLFLELEKTREQLRSAEARKLSAEAALTARTEDFIPLMNERLAKAQARITELEAELAERGVES